MSREGSFNTEASEACSFCRIVSGSVAALSVLEREHVVAFLDHRPLFPGHCLVVPRPHVETLGELPVPLLEPLFLEVQRVARALERGLGAEGTFMAINNRISQSVPHLHVHVVPRRAKDGLRGFFWPRLRYQSEAAMEEVRAAIVRALERP